MKCLECIPILFSYLYFTIISIIVDESSHIFRAFRIIFILSIHSLFILLLMRDACLVLINFFNFFVVVEFYLWKKKSNCSIHRRHRHRHNNKKKVHFKKSLLLSRKSIVGKFFSLFFFFYFREWNFGLLFIYGERMICWLLFVVEIKIKLDFLSVFVFSLFCSYILNKKKRRRKEEIIKRRCLRTKIAV